MTIEDSHSGKHLQRRCEWAGHGKVDWSGHILGTVNTVSLQVVDSLLRDKLFTDTHQSAITLLLITQMDPELFLQCD